MPYLHGSLAVRVRRLGNVTLRGHSWGAKLKQLNAPSGVEHQFLSAVISTSTDVTEDQ